MRWLPRRVRSRTVDPRTVPWPEARERSQHPQAVSCNICGWCGPAFEGVAHCESANCPVCGSIARDRFLYWCWVRSTDYDAGAVVLETSPRLDERYRRHLAELVTYISSDYDESAHRGAIRLDLQDIDLPNESLDVVLTPHVLEHVPDTLAALRELRRVLRPGGHIFLQVPIPHAKTAPPTEPEYHGDRTLVYWRFGWDLAEAIRSVELTCQVLVTDELRNRVEKGPTYEYAREDFDVRDLLRGIDGADLVAFADEQQAERHGFVPGFQFSTFHCQRPT